MTSQEGEFVFVYSENTAVIQDKSTDATKLDYLISEMEELKLQESSGDEKIDKRVVNENSSWFEKSNFENRMIFVTAAEDVFGVGYGESWSNQWAYSIQYIRIGNNSFNRIISTQDAYSFESSIIGIGIAYSFKLNKNMHPTIAFNTYYSTISWENSELSTSGKFNKILYMLTGGIWVEMFERYKPFPIRISLLPGIAVTYNPDSINIENGREIVGDWKLTLLPSISLGIFFPSHKL